MVSREHKIESLHDKLQILRSITHSHAMNETSIVLDASSYIKDLKQKVEKLNGEIATAESSIHQNLWPRATVKALEKGFLVNIHSGKNCPGLLLSILATFEELGLNVIEARVSCADNFHLQALGGESEEDEVNIDAQTVKRAISNTIKNWSESIE
ncbi:transcription factor bhlh93 [Phtheirospermum japonicum]|uniref:Transcription factor bhlh93 n=1 Tax=Phtheirospermum japonicum TaxID=374723 RepID=A0A830CYT0_9LAMI|nr:transcription factor bhlh93 [Phtheirospermum japonicum]